LYASQLHAYPLLRHKPVSVFHDFTSLAGIGRHRDHEGNGLNIVLGGYPWYRKGVDLAIAAFRKIAADFPQARLQIVGHHTDGEPQRLAAGCDQIEILKAVPHDEMMRILNDAAIMILPSRNEGLPRVVIEGMVAGLPVIGSDVAGIPSLIRHGENGFLVPDGDIDALADRMRDLLSDAGLRRRMGERSAELARDTLTEKVYADEFVKMVRATVALTPAARESRGSA
jgi:glycosyltransferase involved in cell wall biosynthesis